MLLHGQPGSGADWALVARRLASDFEVVTPDRPGWGRTGGMAGGFAYNADAVVDLLDRLGRRRAIVAGHSWGGGVALTLALDHADRVAGAVLVASVAPGHHPSPVDRVLALPGIGDVVVPAAFGVFGRLLTLGPARRLLGRTAPGWSGVALRAAIGERDVIPPAAAARGAHRAAGRSFTVEQRAYLAELDALAGRLASITVPVEVVTGDSDHVVAPRLARELTAAIPTATLHEIAGAGHRLLLDHPDEVELALRASGRRSGLLG